MAFSLVAVSFLVFTLFFGICSVLLTGKVNKILQFRPTTIVIGVFLLLFIFGAKYIFYVIDAINMPSPPTGLVILPDAWKSIIHGNLLFANMPDLLLLLLTLGTIFDKTKNFSKAIAPYGIFFGVLYLVLNVFNYASGSYAATIQWYELVFVSDGLTRVPLFTYLFLVLISTWTIISCKEYSRWSITSSIVLGAIIYFYVWFVQLLYNMGSAGLTAIAFDKPYYFNPIKDWLQKPLNIDLGNMEGEYWKLTIVIVGFNLLALVLSFTAKNLFTRDIRRINFIYRPWYYRSRLFSTIGYYVDGLINQLLSKIFKNAYLFGIMPRDVKKVRMYVNYINDMEKSNSNPGNINVANANELDKKLQEKEAKKKAKREKKQKMSREELVDVLTNFDYEVVQPGQTTKAQPTKALSSDQPASNSNQQPATINIIQQWTDENGTTWGLDGSNKYFYLYQNQWVAYQ